MNEFADAALSGLTSDALEGILREISLARYHNRHPLHHKMTSGQL